MPFPLLSRLACPVRWAGWIQSVSTVSIRCTDMIARGGSRHLLLRTALQWCVWSTCYGRMWLHHEHRLVVSAYNAHGRSSKTAQLNLGRLAEECEQSG